MTTSNHRWRAFAICAVIASLTIMDLTKVNVALPAMQHALDATSTQLQLVVSGYVLTFGLALVPAGRLGDQRSRKTLFIVGLAIFTVMSVVAGLAPNATVLVIARLIQGIGAGIQMPQVMGTIQELFHGAERGRAFGIFGAIIGLSTAFGPTLGGVLVALGGGHDGWRWIFLVNLPLGVLTMIATLVFLPSVARKTREPLSMDPVGIALFGIAVIALMWPFLFTTGGASDDPNRWWVLLGFVAAVVLFVRWERRYASTGRHPLIPLTLFRVTSFRNGAIVGALYFAAMPSLFLLGTLYLQDGLGLTAVQAGATTISFALVSAVTSWWGGVLVNRAGRLVIIIGLILMIVSVILLAVVALFVPEPAVPWVFVGVMALGGAGGGLVVSPNQALMLEHIPVSEGGLAGSVGQLGQRIGNAIGSAVGISIFYATMTVSAPVVGDDIAATHAYAVGQSAVVGLLLVTLVVAVLDLRRRRHVGDVA